MTVGIQDIRKDPFALVLHTSVAGKTLKHTSVCLLLFGFYTHRFSLSRLAQGQRQACKTK